MLSTFAFRQYLEDIDFDHRIDYKQINNKIYILISSNMKIGKGSVYNIILSDQKLKKSYFIHKKLSNGCFGYLFLVTNRFTNRKSALKIQLINQNIITLKRQYQFLKKLEGIKGIPMLYNFGRTDNLYYIQLELLDTDINYLTGKSVKPNVNFICEIGVSMLQILEKIHAKNIIHRDIKPQNIMLDKNKNIYLIDFGISHDMSNKTQNDRKKNSFVGTPRYASINAHKGKEQTPADDIQSLMYNLIFLLKKTLPWMNINVEDDKKLETISALKVKKSRSELCKDLPKSIFMTFEYLHKLKQNQKINYGYLIQLFKQSAPKQIKTEVITTNSNLPMAKILYNVNKSRRTSLQTNHNLLNIPLIDIQQLSKSNSQNTIRAPPSQQVMISYNSISACKDQIECNIEQNIDNQQTVDSKIKALQMNHISPKFNLSFR